MVPDPIKHGYSNVFEFVGAVLKARWKSGIACGE